MDSQTDQIAAFESGSPLEALICCTLDLHQELRHDRTAREIWSRACGTLISAQKRGMEKVVPAIIDIWGSPSAWPGKAGLEVWLGSVLQDGAFILDCPSRQSFRVRVQGRPDPDAENESKVEAFFSRTVHSLLELLADADGPSLIPNGAIDFCRDICTHIPSFDQRDAFCSFVLTRWLFNSFIVNALTLPEV